MPVPNKLPRYAELPIAKKYPPKTAWGLFGDDDQVGMFNLQTPERIAAAARLVRKGAVFPMNWDQQMPSPPLFGRGGARHTVNRAVPFGHHGDDVLENFYTQQSSQWDALTHVGDYEHGFWGGVTQQELRNNPDDTRLGIQHWARRGIAGRGVLLDVERWLASQGRPLNNAERMDLSIADLEGTAKAQGVAIQTGDVLLFRTGWITWYEAADQPTRMHISHMMNLATPGLECSEAMAAWLFDHHICAVASDNPALEAWPPPNFMAPDGFLHHWIIGRFGMAIGEMWELDRLAADCAADGVYEFFFTAAPLNVRGGTGSPPNALAIK